MIRARPLIAVVHDFIRDDMSQPPISIIGLGLMGEVYAKRLIDAGFAVTGYDIDPPAARGCVLERPPLPAALFHFHF
jgi:phosphoglycerate dehydrogenase-like enzyme